jgi:hypothetical protein
MSFRASVAAGAPPGAINAAHRIDPYPPQTNATGRQEFVPCRDQLYCRALRVVSTVSGAVASATSPARYRFSSTAAGDIPWPSNRAAPAVSSRRRAVRDRTELLHHRHQVKHAPVLARKTVTPNRMMSMNCTSTLFAVGGMPMSSPSCDPVILARATALSLSTRMSSGSMRMSGNAARWMMDHAAMVRRCYSLLTDGDIDGFRDMLGDDFVEHEPTPGLAPTKDGVLEFFRIPSSCRSSRETLPEKPTGLQTGDHTSAADATSIGCLLLVVAVAPTPGEATGSLVRVGPEIAIASVKRRRSASTPSHPAPLTPIPVNVLQAFRDGFMQQPPSKQ